VRVEKRLDGAVAIRFRDRYLKADLCAEAPKATVKSRSKKAARKFGSAPRRKGNWMPGFLKKPGPPISRAIEIANATS
jgi:hypothetical protein